LFGPDNQAFTQRLSHLFTDEQRDTIGSNFYDVMLGLKLADLAVKGEGENAIMEIWNPNLPEILQDKPINFIRGDVEELEMESVPFVDYDNYLLDDYRYVSGQKILAITGSKGCVRKCTFCDIGVIWPKFKFRSGKHIADEILYLYKTYNVKKFFLTDSLVNGSMSAFKDFVEQLSFLMSTENITDLTWHGQYITRPAKLVDQSIYQSMAKSGAEGLTIGVESGSDAVRDHMKKKFLSVDLDHEMEQFSKHGLDTVLLFFSSYPTETWDDFVDTLSMWVRYQKYAANRTMYKMTLGQPYTHHADTPLYHMQDEIQLLSDPKSDILWSLETNPELDFIERLVRRVISQEVTVALNLPLARNTPELIQLTHTLATQRADIEEYFDLSSKHIPLYYNKHRLPNIADMIMMPPDIQDMVFSHISTVNLTMTFITESDTDWRPEVLVTVGNITEKVTVEKDGTTFATTFSSKIDTKSNLVVLFNNQDVSETYFYKVNDIDCNSTKNVKITSLTMIYVEICHKGDYINNRSAFKAFESVDIAEFHKDAKLLYTNGAFVLDMQFPILNDIINNNTTLSFDDIKNDNEALYDLKKELIKYNHSEVDHWLTLLEKSK